jgi:LacI family transcriptional regulator
MADQSIPRTNGARPTMKDVAALAGVSLKTVSRVINDEQTVDPRLQALVRAAAATLHYLPDMGARSLRRLDRRSSTIAVLLEDLSNPFSATVLRAIEEVAGARGYSVIGGSLDEDATREHSMAVMMARHRVDGMIIAPASDDQSHLAAEQAAGVAMVFVDRPPRGLTADCVVSSSRAGTAGAVRQLLIRGHRRIAFLGDLRQITTEIEREQGYREALAEFDVVPSATLLAHNLRTADAAAEAVGRMLTLADPPTAVFASQNLLTMGSVRALQAAGRQHDVALIGFDDFPMADLLDPAISVVTQDVIAIGREAAGLLFRRIEGDDSPAVHTTIETGFIPRGSGEIAPRSPRPPSPS